MVVRKGCKEDCKNSSWLASNLTACNCDARSTINSPDMKPLQMLVHSSTRLGSKRYDGSMLRRMRAWLLQKSRTNICQIFAAQKSSLVAQKKPTTTGTTKVTVSENYTAAKPGASFLIAAHLIKLFLISCCYTIALSLLLTLTFYLYYHITFANKENKSFEVVSVERLTNQTRLVRPELAHVLSRRSISPTNQLILLPHNKFTVENRTLQHTLKFEIDKSFNGRSKLSKSSILPKYSESYPPPKPYNSPNQSDAFQNLQANKVNTTYSPNNRGALANSSLFRPSPLAKITLVSQQLFKDQNLTNNNQWIPIIDGNVRSRQRVLRVPTKRLNDKVNQAAIEQNEQQRPHTNQEAIRPSAKVEIHKTHLIMHQKPALETYRTMTGAQKQVGLDKNKPSAHHVYEILIPQHSYHHESYHQLPSYPYQHRSRMNHHEYHHHWRKPMFNSAYDRSPILRASKIYRRVLICDKTLVSLDYLRSFIPILKPQIAPHFDSDFDSNFIDFDANFDKFFSDRRATSTNKTSAYDAIGTDVEAANTNNEHMAPGNSFEKRSLLTDEDPLIKCDMWDLEKGLKNRKPPDEILRQAERADFDTVRDAINRCRQLTEKSLPPEDDYRDGIEVMSTEDLMSLFSMKRGLIPGTKWCGLGDQATSYNDLGPKHRIDICCRAHDHCPIRLKPFRNDYGVLNIALYTKSHCDCDADFYRCLREARSRTADMLGNLYFNVMKLQCIREERVKICRETRPVALGFERCIKYEENSMKTVFKFSTPPVAY